MEFTDFTMAAFIQEVHELLHERDQLSFLARNLHGPHQVLQYQQRLQAYLGREENLQRFIQAQQDRNRELGRLLCRQEDGLRAQISALDA